MSSELYHHQLIGARWMVERELSQQAPYGGILADSMGEYSSVDLFSVALTKSQASERQFRHLQP